MEETYVQFESATFCAWSTDDAVRFRTELRQGHFQAGPHTGGCVLFREPAAMEALLR